MDDGPFPTNVPARLDRLRWSSFHSSLIAALGTSWIIDGLEVTLVGSLGSVLTLPTALALTPSEVGEVAGAYAANAVPATHGTCDSLASSLSSGSCS